MSQRIVRLMILLALLPVAGGAEAAHAQAAPSSDRVAYVIVHGAWGGGWAWRQVDSLLTSRGHRVHRPTLTGLGERVHLGTPQTNLSTHVQDVVNSILFEELDDVVLIGHSYGGMVVTGVADRIPDRIRHLVYLDAFLPESGESVTTINGQTGGGMANQAVNGFIVPAWRDPNAPPPGDVPHPVATFTEPLVLNNADALRRIPSTYILTMDPGAERDSFSPYRDRAAARGWKVLQMEADHNPQWSKPGELVDLFAGIR
jgi:pimeloyl-ACP methyl ester carboxylesterase